VIVRSARPIPTSWFCVACSGAMTTPRDRDEREHARHRRGQERQRAGQGEACAASSQEHAREGAEPLSQRAVEDAARHRPQRQAVISGPPTLADPWSLPKAGSATSRTPKHAPRPRRRGAGVRIPGACSGPAQPTDAGSPRHAREGGSEVNHTVPVRTIAAAASRAATGDTAATSAAVSSGPSREHRLDEDRVERVGGGQQRLVVEQRRPERAQGGPRPVACPRPPAPPARRGRRPTHPPRRPRPAR